MTLQTESRGIWPSASAAQPNRLCPGRHLAQINIPEEPSSPDAESGSAIHAAWAGQPYRNLTPEEQDRLQFLRDRESEIFKQWVVGDAEKFREFREVRFWHTWRNGTDHFKCSGQIDRLYIEANRALIIDGKTGRKPAEAESTNLQLRWQAGLVALNTPEITEVTVALAQFWSPQAPPCVYDIFDLGKAVEEMEDDVEACYAAGAPRVPGPEQCQWCRAKATCPAFAASALPAPFEPPGLPTVEQVEKAIQTMDAMSLGSFLWLVRAAGDAAESEVRTRLAAGNRVDGWRLAPGRVTEKIVDPQGVFDRFVLAGGKTEQFLTAITVQKGKLKDQIREVCNVKGKALEAKMAEMLAGLTESKQGEPVLERE